MKKSVISLCLELKPSRLLEGIIFTVHGAALAACLYNALPIAMRLLCVTAVAVSLILALKENRAGSKIIELAYSRDGGWTMRIGDRLTPIELLVSTISTSWVILLHYRIQQHGFQSLLIFSDAVAKEDYRKLKVALRIAASS